MLSLKPGHVTLAQLEMIWRGERVIKLDEHAQSAMLSSAELVAKAALADVPVYGVNTGFGKLASIRIAPNDTQALQRNLILSHCSGVGDDSPSELVRLMMALKLISLGRGASGVAA